ncbi:MAG: leucine-rich repeat domain-containing protein [Alphaproteobacteria bacterium]|nr:leucine-rich repeat domain-containing protein [Alphaproteobacteria bacterium]
MKHLRFLSLALLMCANLATAAENPSGTCGTNCNWEIDGDTLKITGNANGTIGTMINYGYKTVNGVYGVYDSSDNPRPWMQYASQITKIDISGVSNVGNDCFLGLSGVTDIKMDDSVKKIGGYAFSQTNAQTIILPDSLETIDVRAFSNDNTTRPTNLTKLVIPDSVTIIGNSVFGANNEQLQNLEVICKGDKSKCAQVLSGYIYYDDDDGTIKYIPLDLAKGMTVADEKYCNSTNFYWNGIGCVREPDVSKRVCCPVCADLDGYCSRIRYTLPEADEATSNDNENMIEWIFE